MAEVTDSQPQIQKTEESIDQHEIDLKHDEENYNVLKNFVFALWDRYGVKDTKGGVKDTRTTDKNFQPDRPLTLYYKAISQPRDLTKPNEREIVKKQFTIFIKFFNSNKDAIEKKDVDSLKDDIRMSKNIYINLKRILIRNPQDAEELWKHIQNFYLCFTGKDTMGTTLQEISNSDIMKRKIIESTGLEKNTKAHDLISAIVEGIDHMPTKKVSTDPNTAMQQVLTSGIFGKICKTMTAKDGRKNMSSKDLVSVMKGITKCVEEIVPKNMVAEVENAENAIKMGLPGESTETTANVEVVDEEKNVNGEKLA
jgi:hypothetical protein